MTTLFRFIATGHAMNSLKNNEPWLCQCIACRFTKEYKILDEETFAKTLIDALKEEGYKIEQTFC